MAVRIAGVPPGPPPWMARPFPLRDVGEPSRSTAMRALQLAAVGDLRLITRPRPTPTDGAELLQVTACGLCRTDGKMWREGHRDLVIPRILGHECTGRLPGRPGFHVVWPGQACGRCSLCQTGLENLCPEMSILGFHRDGGLAEWVEVREHNLLPLPDGLDTRVATLAEPLACAINGLDQLRLTQGQRLVIHGAGPLGLLLAFAAHDRGLEAVLVERDEKKGHLSKSFREAAGLPLHRPGDVALPRGTFDGAINATSNPTAVAEGLTALRPAGRYCLFSGLSHDANTTNLLNEFHYRQLEMTGAYGCTRAQMSQALALLARKERLLALLLHRRLDLAEAPVALAEVVAGQALRYVVGVEPRS